MMVCRAPAGHKIFRVSTAPHLENYNFRLYFVLSYLNDKTLFPEKEILKRMRDQNSQHVLQRASLRKLLREQGNLLGEELDKMGWMVRYVVKSKLKLLKRQQVMLSQLRNIFIIKQDDASHRMMIFGLKIHSQDQITGMCISAMRLGCLCIMPGSQSCALKDDYVLSVHFADYCL